jgi:hypothetical protein
MTNVLLKKEYPKEYTTTVSTRVSNALLVGEVIGQVVIGYESDISYISVFGQLMNHLFLA